MRNVSNGCLLPRWWSWHSGYIWEYLIAYNHFWVLLIKKYVTSTWWRMLVVLSHSGLHMCVCDSDHQTQINSLVLKKKKKKKNLTYWCVNVPICYEDTQLKETAVSDSLVRLTRKETNTQDQFINKADIFPSHKWRVSHFSLRWVCEWCLQ